MRRRITEDAPQAALPFVQDIVAKAHRLAETGVSGSTREWLDPDVRVFPYRDRLLCYRLEDRRMLLLRVFHQRQDYGQDDVEG